MLYIFATHPTKIKEGPARFLKHVSLSI